VDNWHLTTFPMSSVTVTDGQQPRAAWENSGQVFFADLNRISTGDASDLIRTAAPGATGNRKHPAIATNARGASILVWTEGTGWKKGGSLAWQVFDRNGKPTAERGAAPDVPVWGLATVVAEADRNFTIVY
jgi:hypothetical protein